LCLQKLCTSRFVVHSRRSKPSLLLSTTFCISVLLDPVGNMANKLDMSLDDLIKKTGRTKPAGKQADGKPGAQKKQQAGKPGMQQQKGAGGKGAAKPAAGQQKKGAGVQLKAKGGVAKPGAGKVRRAARSSL
jgi:hypothetical protein